MIFSCCYYHNLIHTLIIHHNEIGSIYVIVDDQIAALVPRLEAVKTSFTLQIALSKLLQIAKQK